MSGQQIQKLLIELSLLFKSEYQKTQENQKGQQQRNREMNQPEIKILQKQPIDEIELDYQSQNTWKMLAQNVSEHIFDPKIYALIQHLQVRQISPKRLNKLFSGQIERQKNGMIQQKSKMIYIPNKIPDRFNVKAQIKLNQTSQVIALHHQDLQKLSPTSYLNDTIILSYIKLLKQFAFPPQITSKAYILSTFFMSKLLGFDSKQKVESKEPKKSPQKFQEQIKSNYKSITNWMRKVDIFDKDYLIIPINSAKHWNLILIINPKNLQSEQLEFQIIGLDSMYEIESKFYQATKIYLRTKLGQVYPNRDLKNLKFLTKQLIVPRQKNDYDCGLYLLCYIEALFTNPAMLKRLKQPEVNFLDLFSMQFIFQMRVQVGNLFYDLMTKKNKEQKVQLVKKYFISRKKLLSQPLIQYDSINLQRFEMYKRLQPILVQKFTNDQMIHRFYLDKQVNYYQQTSKEPKRSQNSL